ncbi:hypothetical protein H1R20_g15153, partial [Candolleomyces eurysporus]
MTTNVPTTPRGKSSAAAHHPTTPATQRITTAHITQASPSYTTTRRHSLYGVEDRVVIDPGSRIWKVGFSGEGKPRDVFYTTGQSGEALWKLSRSSDPQDRAEGDRILEIRLQQCLRSVFHDSLLTDPKARKVIIVEGPLLPIYIKEMMARILFENQAETSVHGLVKSEGYLQALASMYKKHSTATDLKMRVQPVQQVGTGLGTLIIPGWIRERAAEVLFEGDVDESSLAEIILDALLKVPIDLRKTLTSSILVSGGTAMLPGFIPRLHSEILKALSPPPAPPPSRQNSPSKSNRPPPPQYDKYAALRPLTPYFAILNNPTPPAAPSERARANAGKAPAFAPAMLAWVGGSLAGALKTGGSEVIRENWDETEGPGGTGEDENEASDAAAMDVTSSPSRKAVLPDWTRSPLRPGAPSARAPSGADALAASLAGLIQLRYRERVEAKGETPFV